VRRVSLVAERGSPVRLAFGDDEVMIEAGSQGQARAVERVPAVFAGDERVIAFSPHYLLDGLTAAATPSPAPAGSGGSTEDAETARRAAAPGRIRLQFTSAVRPAVITAVPGGPDDDEGQAGPSAGPSAGMDGGTPDFRYLVVPLRMPGST
jgi:DNA polymerase-3 subunit beta